MTDLPMKVFIVKYIIVTKPLDEPHNENRQTPSLSEVVAHFDVFADWFLKRATIFGAAFRGPMVQSDLIFEDHFLLCLHSPWPEINGADYLQTKLAKGEIFVSGKSVYFAQIDTLTSLESEVLKDWYHNEHGTDISDLAADLRRRLSRSCRYELQSLGYNGMTIRELMPRWIAAVYRKQPAEWDRAWLASTLKEIVHDFDVEIEKEDDGWFSYEALMKEGGPDLHPPVENGEIILEVIEKLVDEPGESRQWLVRAHPIFGHSQVCFPEFETIRPIEDCEIFSSHRGVFWNGGSEGVWLGEIGCDLFHEQHGEAIEEVEDRLRDHIIESLVSGIEARSGCDDFSRIIEAIDAELKQIDICELWFHDLGPLAERVIEVLRTSA